MRSHGRPRYDSASERARHAPTARRSRSHQAVGSAAHQSHEEESKLPREKTLATFDFTRVPTISKQLVAQLCGGSFVDEGENLMGFGNPGTGKSHLFCGIAHELIRNGRSVFFSHAYALVQHLVKAKCDLRLAQEIKRLDRFDVVLVDDLGYVQQNRDEMDVLFTLFAERYERRSIMITSNLVFSKWDQIFRDPMTTAAAMDASWIGGAPGPRARSSTR